MTAFCEFILEYLQKELRDPSALNSLRCMIYLFRTNGLCNPNSLIIENPNTTALECFGSADVPIKEQLQ